MFCPDTFKTLKSSIILCFGSSFDRISWFLLFSYKLILQDFFDKPYFSRLIQILQHVESFMQRIANDVHLSVEGDLWLAISNWLTREGVSIKPVRILKVSVEHWINYEGFDILLFKFNQKFKLQHIHTAFKFQPANQGWCTWNSERIVVLLIISFGKYSKVRYIKEGGWKKISNVV
jgi:hypothetical protein